MPMRKFLVSGSPYDCLCDSGACTTVLTKPPPGHRPSNKVVWVRSASGHITRNHLSEPLEVMDLETQRVVRLQVLVDSSCPINLLGRDGMLGFDLAVVPVAGKMKCMPMCVEGVVQAALPPHYYWTLDVEPGGSVQLLAQLPPKPKVDLETQSASSVHCTMWYKRIPGPDTSYDEQMSKLKGSATRITDLFITQEGEAAAAVSLSAEQKPLYRGCYPPHVSLRKLKTSHWKDMGAIVQKGEKIHWPQCHAGVWVEDKTTGMKKVTLNWWLRVKPAVHLDDETT